MALSNADSIRSGLQTSQDPRVGRSRAAIIAAARELAAKAASGSVITAFDVIRTAGVSKGLFYSHFANLDEVVTLIFRSEFELNRRLYLNDYNDPKVNRLQALRSAQVRIVNQFTNNRPLFAGLATQSGTVPIRAEMTRSLTIEISATLATLDSIPPDVQIDIVATYIVGGITALMNAWLLDEIVASPDKLVEHLLRQLPAWLSAPHSGFV
jgi:AcrR family transcriptional regulator